MVSFDYIISSWFLRYINTFLELGLVALSVTFAVWFASKVVGFVWEERKKYVPHPLTSILPPLLMSFINYLNRPVQREARECPSVPLQRKKETPLSNTQILISSITDIINLTDLDMGTKRHLQASLTNIIEKINSIHECKNKEGRIMEFFSIQSSVKSIIEIVFAQKPELSSLLNENFPHLKELLKEMEDPIKAISVILAFQSKSSEQSL